MHAIRLGNFAWLFSCFVDFGESDIQVFEALRHDLFDLRTAIFCAIPSGQPGISAVLVRRSFFCFAGPRRHSWSADIGKLPAASALAPPAQSPCRTAHFGPSSPFLGDHETLPNCMIRCSIVVNMSAHHAEELGSITGGGVFRQFQNLTVFFTVF